MYTLRKDLLWIALNVDCQLDIGVALRHSDIFEFALEFWTAFHLNGGLILCLSLVILHLDAVLGGIGANGTRNRQDVCVAIL